MSVDESGDVALSIGFNFGEPRQATPDMLALAERIGVPVVALAPRGVGDDGGISLDCPEVGGLETGAGAEPDSASRDAFVTAVTACKDRLTSDGVALKLFGIDDIAEDVEDLRSALEVEQWFLDQLRRALAGERHLRGVVRRACSCNREGFPRTQWP